MHTRTSNSLIVTLLIAASLLPSAARAQAPGIQTEKPPQNAFRVSTSLSVDEHVGHMVGIAYERSLRQRLSAFFSPAVAADGTAASGETGLRLFLRDASAHGAFIQMHATAATAYVPDVKTYNHGGFGGRLGAQLVGASGLTASAAIGADLVHSTLTTYTWRTRQETTCVLMDLLCGSHDVRVATPVTGSQTRVVPRVDATVGIAF